MKGIFVAPEFDDVTVFSFKWNERLRDEIGDRMEKELLLVNDATRANDEYALKKYPTAIHIHYDHGNEDSIIGQDGKAVIDLSNVSLLSGREAYNMNCLSAKTLGKAAYEAGCLAYWGFVEVVSFTSDAEKDFGEAFNYGFLLRIEGKSWKECLDLTKARMTEIIDDLVKRGNGLAAMLLREDRDALHCWGPGIETPTEGCPVSKGIVFLFGYGTLNALRKMRSRLTRNY